jgi:hypothetical protein
MRSRLFVASVLAIVVIAPLRSQSIAAARVGLASQTATQPAALRYAASLRIGGSSLPSSGEESGDKWAKGMMAGALVGLIVGFLININQLQNGGTHSAILPAVGIGALLGLMIGTG